MNRKSLSLSHKLIFGMLFFTVFGLAVAVFIVETVVHNIVYDNILESTYRDRFNQARQVDAWFQDANHIVNNLAETLPLVGRELYQDIVEHFFNRYDFTQFVWVALEDNGFYGSALWTPQYSFVNRERPWWILSEAQSGEVVITLPYISMETGGIVTTVARHTRDWSGDGQAGVVAVNIELEQLDEMMYNFQLGAEGYLFLISSGGEIIVHPNRAYLPSLLGLRHMSDMPGYAEVFEGFMEGERIVSHLCHHGVPSYFMQFTLPSTDWIFVSVVPAAVASIPVGQILTAMLITIIIVLTTVAVFLFVFISSRLVKPVQILTAGIREVAAGNLNVSIDRLNHYIPDTKRTDEIGYLTQSIQNMLSEISKFQENERRRETEERANFMLENTPAAIIMYDEYFNPIDCNDRVLSMFGFTEKNEFLAKYYYLAPDSQPDGTASLGIIKKHAAEALESGYSSIPNYMCYRADGTAFPVETTLVRMRYRNNFIVLEYSREATEKIQAEINERIRLMLEAAPLSVTLYDENYSLVECNLEAARMFGFDSKETFIKEFNRNILDFSMEYQPCGTLSKQKRISVFEQTIRDGRTQFEWMHLTRLGEEIPTYITLTKIGHVGMDMYVAYVGDLRDIKRLEKQRLEAIEESSRAKSRFLARMSHEIRTPIAAVLGISEVHLRSKELPPHLEEALVKIYDSSKMLLNIVNDILDFTKIESGKMPIINVEYDVASLVSDAAQLHLVFLERKEVAFKITVEEALPARLIGDALRIRQIINNLLTNAFKYTEAGSVSLSLQCEPGRGEYVTLIASIQDTGVGMTPEQLAETKGEYARFREHDKPFVSGTGLGLPIVYSLVQMLGAQIDIMSEPDKGTNAVIRIPQKVSGTEVLGPETARNLQSLESGIWSIPKELEFVPEQLPNGRVLVVDDVDTNLYVAEAMLESFGLNIDLCESGQDAIDKIKNGSTYDIIFMDHMMPGMDGIEATSTLRNMGYSRPIIALTANAVKGQAEMFMNNGFSGFMSKPIDIKILNSYLVRFIKKISYEL